MKTFQILLSNAANAFSNNVWQLTQRAFHHGRITLNDVVMIQNELPTNYFRKTNQF